MGIGKKWLGSIDQFRPGSRGRPGPDGVQGQRPLTTTTFTAKMSSTSIDDVSSESYFLKTHVVDATETEMA